MNFMVANFLLSILPPTRWFGLKRFFLRRLGVNVGEGTSICGRVQFFGSGKIVIGRDCWIGLNSHFYLSKTGGITIGDNCDIAPEACFITGTHQVGPGLRRAGQGYAKDIMVGAGSWIGVRTTILGGAIVGPGSIIGAGSLILGKTWPSDRLLLGLPAKITRHLDL